MAWERVNWRGSTRPRHRSIMNDQGALRHWRDGHTIGVQGRCEWEMIHTTNADANTRQPIRRQLLVIPKANALQRENCVLGVSMNALGQKLSFTPICPMSAVRQKRTCICSRCSGLGRRGAAGSLRPNKARHSKPIWVACEPDGHLRRLWP